MSSPSSKPNCFVTELDLSLSSKLKKDLEEQGFAFSTPAYSIFSAKKKGIHCTLYQSGKLVVQGKEMSSFIEFYLEPEILKSFSFTYKDMEENLSTRIGVDEAGKGDFFGPLCIASVYGEEKSIQKLLSMGIKDSKRLSDKKALELAKEIRKICPYHRIVLWPEKYNELYKRFSNLNTLLAWGHATAIESLQQKTQCPKAVIDQFAQKSVLERAVQQKKINIELIQRHKAESDVVVAAASILARASFLEGLDTLSQKYAYALPKGASQQVIEKGKTLIAKYEPDILEKVAKTHFKTLESILN